MRLPATSRRLALRLGVLVLATLVLRLPIYDLFRYGILVAAALVVFTGTAIGSAGLRLWSFRC